jgi:hypothetical protein
MRNQTRLGKVEIHTPHGMVTLTNALIVKGGLYLPSQAGAGGNRNRTTGEHTDTNELEEFSFVFGKIRVENLSGSASDDWTDGSH